MTNNESERGKTTVVVSDNLAEKYFAQVCTGGIYTRRRNRWSYREEEKERNTGSTRKVNLTLTRTFSITALLKVVRLLSQQKTM